MKKKIRTLCAIFYLFLVSPPLFAQNIGVSGSVLDETGESLIGVSVVLKGTKNATITDTQGKFRIQAPEGAILVFSYISYQTEEVVVKNNVPLKIVLKPASKGLDEVVVIGYGTQSKKTVTSAISKVSGDVLKDIPITSVGDGLKGKVAGAHFYTSNNSPGSDPVIRIRGGSSINNSNEPLVLVDGVERGLGGINPNDIESVEVLKDATSSAIYGARASNGVVLITTRKGSKGKEPRITFEATNAIQNTERTYDYMNAADYINTVRPAVAVSKAAATNFASGYSASSGNNESSIYSSRYLNPGETVPAGYKSMADPLDPSKTLIFQDNSYVDQIYQQAYWQNYYLGIDGSSEKIQYNASLGYLDDGGVAISTGFKRFSAHANTSVELSKKLKFTSGIDFSQALMKEFRSQYQVITRGLATPATQKIYFADGTPTPGYNVSSPNPVFYDYYNDDNQKRNLLTLNGALDYTITEGLKANVQASLFTNTYQADYFEKANIFNGSRTASTNLSDIQRKRLEGFLSYNKTFQSTHSLSAMAGYSYQDYYYKYVGAASSGASSDKIPSLNAGPTKTEATSFWEKEALTGFFGRFMYDYSKKYLFMFTFREDGSSRFAAGNQWGFFPGVSAGWVLSEEQFLKNSKQISELKIRTSYGQTGNNTIGLYDAGGKFAVNSKYDGGAAIIPSAMPNRNLTWETSTQLDVGLDVGLFNNRIKIAADYFNKITNNLLFNKVLPNTSGFSSVLTNVGKVKFEGFEFEINTSNIRNDNFSWDSRLTWSFVKNKVLKLPVNGNDKNRIGGTTIKMPDGSTYQIGGIAEGESLYEYYGFVTDGILETREAADNARFDEQARGYRFSDGLTIAGRKEVGDYEWKDRNGDGRINGQDIFKLGSTMPTITGGLNNSFSYKNFSLNIFVDWALGHSINDNVMSRYFTGIFANNFQLVNEVKQAWKQPGDQTIYARYTANDSDEGNKNFRTASNIFNYKADYLAIRELSLQYKFPESFVKKIGVQALSLLVGGSNLHYFTAVKGISPELGSASPYATNFNTYPPIRRISFGGKVTF